MLCTICFLDIADAGFKNHLRNSHNIVFLDYAKKNRLIYVYNGKKVVNYDFNCKLCKKSLDKWIVPRKDEQVLRKVGCSCSNFKDVRNTYLAVFGNLDNYHPKLKGRFTLEWFVHKYGSEEGTKKYYYKNKYCGTSLESFVMRYGTLDGEKKYLEFKDRCSISLDNMIKKYGENVGREKYNNFISKQRRRSPRTLQYQIDNGYTEIDAIKYRREFNSLGTNLKYLKYKYGEKEGEEKYNKANLNRVLNNNGNGSISKSSIKCFDEILEIFGWNLNNCLYGYKKEMIVSYLNDDNIKKFFRLDFFHTKFKLWIEFNGSWQHAKKFKDGDIIKRSFGYELVSDIRKKDLTKINIVCNTLGILPPFIIQDDEWLQNKQGIINNIKKHIKDNFNEDS